MQWDDFVTLGDLAPTFLDAAGIAPSAEMSCRSLYPLLSLSGGEYMPVKHAIYGRERHTCAQGDPCKGYPVRALRTHDYLYIRNFEPDRWPVGEPDAYRDVDNSPTKKFMLAHRTSPDVRELFERAFAKRPAEELYDLQNDPEQMRNVADIASYRDVREAMARRLMQRMEETDDPRARGNDTIFDSYAYYMIKRIHQ
jgi:arylsulfatase A-like enzyme